MLISFSNFGLSIIVLKKKTNFRTELVWLKGDGDLLIHDLHLYSLPSHGSWGSFVHQLCSLQYVLGTSSWPDTPWPATWPHLEHWLPHLPYIPLQPCISASSLLNANEVPSHKALVSAILCLWKGLLCPSPSVCPGKNGVLCAKMLKYPSFMRSVVLMAPCFVLLPSLVHTPPLGRSGLGHLCFPSAQPPHIPFSLRYDLNLLFLYYVH